MKLNELKESLELAITHIPPGEDIDVAFEICDESAYPRYVYFNICTIYPNNRLIVFSIEGNVVEIFRKEAVA